MSTKDWLSYDAPVATVKADLFYPEMLAKLGTSPDTADQMDMETAYRFMQWTVKMHLITEQLDPRLDKPPQTLQIYVVNDVKADWARKSFPEGKAKDMTWREQLQSAQAAWTQATNLPVPM